MPMKINPSTKNILTTTLLAFFVLLAIPLGWDSPYLSVRFFSVGFTVGGMILFLVWRRADASTPFSIPIIIIPMGIFVFWQTVLLAITPLPPYGIDKILVNLASLLFFVIFADTIPRITPHRWENALLFSIGAASVVEMLPIAAWYLRWQQMNGAFFPLPPLAYRLPGVMLVHANIVAGVVNIAFGIALVRLLRQSSWLRRARWGIFLLFLMAVMYFSSSRGGMLGMLTEIVVIPALFFGQYLTRMLQYLRHRNYGWLWQQYWKQFAIGMILFAGLMLLTAQRIALTPGKGSISSARAGIWQLSWQVFQTSPWFGVGTGGFDPLYAQFGQMPPGYVAPHAHNLGMQILATTGIMGVLIALLGVGTGVWALWVHFRTDANQWRRFAAYLGIFAAMGVHHLVDYLLWQPVYTTDFLLVMAFIFTATPHRTQLKIPTRAGNVVVVAAVALFLWGTTVSLRGYSRYSAGVTAAQTGDFQTAQSKICAAADAFPAQTLYQFECGLAAATLGTPKMLDTAIRHLQSGWQQDSYWTVHQINLAILYRQQNNSTAAKETFTAAIYASPKNYLYYLNLGRMAEEENDSAAVEFYQQALFYRPDLKDTFFMQQTSVRTEAIRQAWYTRAKSRGSTTIKYAGWDALIAGEPAIAKIIFRENIRRAPNASYAYCGLAQLEAAAGRWSAAERNLLAAQFIAPDAPIVAHTTATIERARKNDVRAAATLFKFFQTLRDTTAQQMIFSRQYYFAVYHRLTLPYDFVPQTSIPILTVDMVNDFRWLIDFYRQTGNTKNATEIEQWLNTRITSEN